MNINLEKLRIGHAAVSWKWRNDPDIWEYTLNKPSQYVSKNDEANWMVNVLQRENESRFAILVDGVYIGNTYLTNICDGEAEFHIFIGNKKYWGKGIGTEVIGLIVQKARELNLRSLYLWVNREHSRAYRLYLKNGFVQFDENDDLIGMRRVL